MANADRVRAGWGITHAAWVLLVLAVAAACGPGSSETAMNPAGDPAPPAAAGEAQAHSLLGEPLYAPELPEPVRLDREQKLAAARADFDEAPEDADAIIWLGRRTAYLGRYREAVEIFSRGVELHPDDPRMYRHRGHRRITLRRLDDAVADLEHASRLIVDWPDEIEPDGLPNARNQPTSTSHSNIWYHLGLAYYLQGDLQNAARCYRKCMRFSNNPDMLSATSHWLYMTLRRLGREDEAAMLLEPIDAEMDIIENAAYHRLLLMYKGEVSADDLLDEMLGSESALDLATLGYGLANWEVYNGRHEAGRSILERIVEGEQWAAFGHLAAEADLRVLR